MPLANLLWWPPQAKSSLSWGLAPPLYTPWCDLMPFLNWGKDFLMLFSLVFSNCSSLHVLTLDMYMLLVTDMSQPLNWIVTVWRAIMWWYHTHYRCDSKTISWVFDVLFLCDFTLSNKTILCTEEESFDCRAHHGHVHGIYAIQIKFTLDCR